MLTRKSFRLFQILCQVVPRTLGVGRILVEIGINTRIIEIQSAPPIAQVHCNSMVSMKGGPHPSRFLGHVELRLKNIQFDFRLQQRQQNNLIPSRVPVRNQVISLANA